jgi:hypothetical protein
VPALGRRLRLVGADLGLESLEELGRDAAALGDLDGREKISSRPAGTSAMDAVTASQASTL